MNQFVNILSICWLISQGQVAKLFCWTKKRWVWIMLKMCLVIVSMIYSRTEILQKEVFFIDCLDRAPKEKLMHLKAVVFCRCTDENIKLITMQIQNPTFSSYFLCKLTLANFSSLLEHGWKRCAWRIGQSWLASTQCYQAGAGSICWLLDHQQKSFLTSSCLRLSSISLCQPATF